MVDAIGSTPLFCCCCSARVLLHLPDVLTFACAHTLFTNVGALLCRQCAPPAPRPARRLPPPHRRRALFPRRCVCSSSIAPSLGWILCMPLCIFVFGGGWEGERERVVMIVGLDLPASAHAWMRLAGGAVGSHDPFHSGYTTPPHAGIRISAGSCRIPPITRARRRHSQRMHGRLLFGLPRQRRRARPRWWYTTLQARRFGAQARWRAPPHCWFPIALPRCRCDPMPRTRGQCACGQHPQPEHLLPRGQHRPRPSQLPPDSQRACWSRQIGVLRNGLSVGRC